MIKWVKYLTIMKFVHLHTHSHYSLLDGLSKVDEMVKLAKSHGMTAIGLTDHGAMYGAIDFYTACVKNGIKPIIGVEAYVANRSRFQKEPHIDNKRYHLTLLAKNNTGYQNLIKLTTAAHLEGYYYKPRVDKDLLREHSEGLIALSGCFGSELGRAIQSRDKTKAEAVILEYQSIFGPENYYLEIMDHPDVEFFQEWKKALIEFSRKLNIPLVATQDSHYLHPDDAFAHKTLVAISTNTDIGDTAIFSGKGEYHFISTEEALEKFKDIPEAVENTEKIAERCNINLTLGKFIFPDFAIEPGKTADQMLDELTLRGAKEKGLDKDPEVESRRQYELEIIKNKNYQRKNYAPYFLVVADLLRFAHESKIYTTVRGSVAGSIVAYLSSITHVNPIEFQLPFERFLNPFRPTAPDIDMDFADNRRQEVIEYAKKKYGADKVAQIGTFGTMMARGAVRDVARALGKSYETGNRIAKLIPMGSQGFPMTIDHALEVEPELKNLHDHDPEVRQILDVSKKLEGTVRHVSVHAAGVVISPKPLIEYVPIQYDSKESSNLITQYDMYTVGEDGVGLTKFDFLGIRNLAILENAVHLVKKHRNIDIDIEKIHFDDKKTFTMLAKGETEGLFQLNGSGMTKYLVELKPTTIHDINAMVALYRPGPINNIPEYIARKQGYSPIRYFHPKAEKFLAKSYGVLVYQDDLLSTAMELAGYNWETVDKFRKAVGKKIPAEMAKQHEIFVQGCQTHSGMTKDQAENIWNLFEPFQGYGFNKAHAACYGRVAYQTAYMKANFPAEYMCAVLTAESGNTEKIAEIISECQRMKIPVLSPDINSCFKDFTVIKGDPEPPSLTSYGTGKDQIRFGLLTIKNLGESIADTIITEREASGPYKNIEDFVNRIQNKDLNKKSFESLVKCGALDAFGERNVLLFNMENLLNYARDKQKNKNNGQISLFGNTEEVNLPLRLIDTTPAHSTEKLIWEKELLGLYVSDHPLNTLQAQLKLENVIPIKNISISTVGSIKIGGIITKVQKIITKTGKPMLFSHVEDLTSKIEMVVFPNVFEKNPEIWKENSIIIARGKVNDRDGAIKFLCDEVKALSAIA
ncbi:MAG: DNA polymerase III subunit alpha [bacterium]|nr:DNA polymerase III subunit alpha [bacterium]